MIYIEHTIKLKILRLTKKLFEDWIDKHPDDDEVRHKENLVILDEMEYPHGYKGDVKCLYYLEKKNKNIEIKLSMIRSHLKGDKLVIGYWNCILKDEFLDISRYFQSLADKVNDEVEFEIRKENAKHFISRLNMKDFKNWVIENKFGL